MGAKEILEVLPQTNEVDQTAPRFHLDQEVHVAPRARLATRDRAEHSNIARTVLGRIPQNLIPPRTEPMQIELSGFGSH